MSLFLLRCLIAMLPLLSVASPVAAQEPGAVLLTEDFEDPAQGRLPTLSFEKGYLAVRGW